MGYVFLLVAGTLFAWRFSKCEPDLDWPLFNLWAFLGCVPYRDHQEIKPPGIFIWYWLLTRIVGKDVPRVRFVHHFIINLGALIALHNWGFVAGLTWLMLMNAIHFHAQGGNVECVAALFLTIMLATSNPWLKVIAFSLACFFNLKVMPMGIILWPHLPEVLVISAIWLVGFGIFYKLKPDIGRAVLKTQLYETRATQKNRIGWIPWIKQQVLGNDTWYQGYGIALLWGGLAIQNRPDFWFWLPCILYLALGLTGKMFGTYHFLIFVPWIAIAMPQTLWLVLLISVSQLAWNCFYAQDIYFLSHRGIMEMVLWARPLGHLLKGKKFWVNGWGHILYIYADVYPQYGIECQTSGPRIPEWPERRNKLLKEGPPDYVIECMGRDKAVNVRSARKRQMGPYTVYQVRGTTGQ